MTNYKVDKIVKGNVSGIEKYGIFINLENFYTGLIHISEISNDYIKDINDYVNLGEIIYVKILSIDEQKNQMALSIKNLDYRLKETNFKNSKIKEVGTGFELLEKCREKWIAEKNQ